MPSRRGNTYLCLKQTHTTTLGERERGGGEGWRDVGGGGGNLTSFFFFFLGGGGG